MNRPAAAAADSLWLSSHVEQELLTKIIPTQQQEQEEEEGQEEEEQQQQQEEEAPEINGSNNDDDNIDYSFELMQDRIVELEEEVILMQTKAQENQTLWLEKQDALQEEIYKLKLDINDLDYERGKSEFWVKELTKERNALREQKALVEKAAEAARTAYEEEIERATTDRINTNVLHENEITLLATRYNESTKQILSEHSDQLALLQEEYNKRAMESSKTISALESNAQKLTQQLKDKEDLRMNQVLALRRDLNELQSETSKLIRELRIRITSLEDQLKQLKLDKEDTEEGLKIELLELEAKRRRDVERLKTQLEENTIYLKRKAAKKEEQIHAVMQQETSRYECLVQDYERERSSLRMLAKRSVLVVVGRVFGIFKRRRNKKKQHHEQQQQQQQQTQHQQKQLDGRYNGDNDGYLRPQQDQQQPRKEKRTTKVASWNEYEPTHREL